MKADIKNDLVEIAELLIIITERYERLLHILDECEDDDVRNDMSALADSFEDNRQLESSPSFDSNRKKD